MPKGIYVRTNKHHSLKTEFKKGHIPWNKNKHIYLGGGFKKGIRKPEQHWNWKGGLPKCIDCSKELKNYKANRCIKCAGNIRRGRKKIFSKQHIKNLSKSLKGRKVWNKGILMKHSGSFQLGIKHPNWKGGKNRNKHSTTEPKYKQWRKEVFERDNYICQNCFKKGGYLEAHHKKSWNKYPNLRYNIDNGITLCKKCHKNIKRNKPY